MLHIDESALELLLERKKDKIEKSRYDGIGEIVSAISLIFTLCLADFSNISFVKPSYFKIAAWIITICILAFGIICFIKSLTNTYSIYTLYSEIADLDPLIEHPFNIILIKHRRMNGKYLLFKNKRWNCWLFPNYRCLDGEFNQNEETRHIEACLIRDLNVRQMRIRYLGNEISRKYSVADKINKKYNFHYFQVDDLTIDDNGKRSFQLNGKKYCWKTLDQMYSDKGMIKKNQDVLDYVRKTCDMS